MKEGTPPPSTEAPVFHAYQTGIYPSERRHPSPLYPPFFTPTKLEYTPMKEGTPAPSTEAPVFYAFQTGTQSDERKHSCPLYRSPCFFTPSKLEQTTMKEGTPTPSNEVPVETNAKNHDFYGLFHENLCTTFI